jgi:hypothetical protein
MTDHERESEIQELVDEFADEVELPALEKEAQRVGIAPQELLDRVFTEVQRRLEA